MNFECIPRFRSLGDLSIYPVPQTTVSETLLQIAVDHTVDRLTAERVVCRRYRAAAFSLCSLARFRGVTGRERYGSLLSSARTTAMVLARTRAARRTSLVHSSSLTPPSLRRRRSARRRRRAARVDRGQRTDRRR